MSHRSRERSESQTIYARINNAWGCWLGTREHASHRVDTALRLGHTDQILAIFPRLSSVQAHAFVAIPDHARHVFAIVIEAPLETGRSERERVRLVISHPYHPCVPSLAITVELALECFLLSHVGQARHPQLPGQHFEVVGMPVRLLFSGKGAIQLLRNDVLDPHHPGLGCITVEQHALSEVFVDLVAVVVGFHLHFRVVFCGVETVKIQRDLFDGRLRLHEVGAGFEGSGLGCPAGAGCGIATLRWSVSVLTSSDAHRQR